MDLRSESSRLINVALATNTTNAYNTGLNSFEKFRTVYSILKDWPPSIDTIALFIAWLSLQGLKDSTARLYINAIGFQCKIRGCNDISRNFVVQKALEGLKRSVRRNSLRLPITQVLLKGILGALQNVCSNEYETRLFTAAYCLAFFGFLRVSELVATNRSNTGFVIMKSDIIIDGSGESLLLVIRHSKNDQHGHGAQLKLCRTGTQICPVLSVQRFLLQRPFINGPLLCHLDGAPLTRYQFSAILKRCLSRLGLQYDRYTSHSFRIGAATAAAVAGYPPDVIQRAGRWRSDAYHIYIRPDSVITLPKL